MTYTKLLKPYKTHPLYEKAADLYQKKCFSKHVPEGYAFVGIGNPLKGQYAPDVYMTQMNKVQYDNHPTDFIFVPSDHIDLGVES